MFPHPVGSQRHLLYAGCSLAAHAVSWGFIFVWTTTLGLLRDGKGLAEFVVAAVGGCLFTASALMLRHAQRRDPFAQEITRGVVGFYVTAAICTYVGRA